MTEIPPVEKGDLETEDERVLRQSSIETQPNPIGQTDYLCHLTGTLTVGTGARIAVALRYVPDKWILRPAAFAAYLASLSPPEGETMELTAQLMLDDFSNQLVPRWQQITLSGPDDLGSGKGADANGNGAIHRILVEDRQPQWDNPSLLQRVAPF